MNAAAPGLAVPTGRPASRSPVATVSLVALALGYFAMGTVSLAVVGLGASIGGGLGVPAARVGLLVTVFAVVFGLAAPLVPAVFGRWNRRTELLAGLVLLTVGEALSALSTNFAEISAFRVLAALGAAVFGPNASAAGAALVPAERRQSALAVVFGGMTVATVLGVPLATFLGDAAGWRGATWAVTGVCALATAAVLFAVPRLPEAAVPHTREYLKVLRTPGAVTSVGTTLLMIAGSFATYGVIGKFLADRFELSSGAVSVALLVYGVIGVVMNIAAPRLGGRFGAAHAVLGGLVVFAALLAALLVTPHSVVGVIPFVLWPCGLQVVMVLQQGRQVQLVPDQPGVILALNASALYLGMSLGSFLASLLYAAVGAGTLPAFGLGLTALALLAHIMSLRSAHDR